MTGPEIPRMVTMHDEKLLSEVEKEFTTTLLRARQTIRERAKAIHPELQAPGYRILSFLIHHDAQQQGVLAEHLELDKATISRMVKQLETMGLITRTSDPNDGRAQLVSVTGKAREAWKVSGNTLRERLHRRLSEWDETDVRRFADLLHRMNEEIEDPQ
ncbi:MarR family transcriptional regulator [Arthrobacter sp. MYb211]|nr:MarR family transcriptional regulator [Arthrobacter sp. MYb224]PRA04651.1 MarR family transcriptional regulator [Arthrobacter sp. MYb229]PRA10621.1 MarR family transcriptional regulator [Arthrobacter sp. MYb221]PRB51436.1 MarR family transcriptional regulator [Arthrobacter sp. MYb216]PRC06311.1 MarR family transcriptional regulator [Arthrobacter sp. MYb211]